LAYEVATRAEGKYTRVALAVPSTAYVGDTVSFTVKGVLTATPYYWPNFAIGLWYVDGPVDKLKVWIGGVETETRKNVLTYKISEKLEYGTVETMVGRIKIEKAGTYVFKGVAGYYDERKDFFHIDSEDEGKIEAKSPITIPPTVPTVPTVPGGPEIPWWPIAIVGAVVAVIGIVAAIVIHEEEKEMLYMMMLLR